MKLRTVHLWMAVVAWLYTVNIGAGFMACYLQWRSPAPESPLAVEPPKPEGSINEPTKSDVPAEQPVTTGTPAPPRLPEPTKTQARIASKSSVTGERRDTPPRPPPPPSRLKGRCLVLVLRTDEFGNSRPAYDPELAALKRTRADDLLGGNAWVLGPNSEPEPWPGGASRGSFACNEAAEAFEAADATLAWFDQRAESPGMPVVLIWPCAENPDNEGAPKVTRRIDGRTESVIWVGGPQFTDSAWLNERFGQLAVTHIDGGPGGQLVSSLGYILDSTAAGRP